MRFWIVISLIALSSILVLGCAFVAGKPSKTATVDLSADISMSHALFGVTLKNESIIDELSVAGLETNVSSSTASTNGSSGQ